MIPRNTTLFDWDSDAYNNFGQSIQCLKHNYTDLDLTSDEYLIKLLDSYPREWLQCFTMGYNPEDYTEWKAVHIADSTGEEILTAVKKGRFWINIININAANEDYKELIQNIYQKLNAKCPHLKTAKAGYSALILSSPSIQVYYHLDAEANMLWHFRGKKKLWVYPRNEMLSPQEELEKVVAHERDEDLTYKKEYDKYAQTFEINGGDVLSWPIHSPHRVENLTFNVSLTSSYTSKETRRINGVHSANYFLLRKLGFNNNSTQHNGTVALLKSYSYYILNKLRLIKHKKRTSYYKTNLKLDHTADTGMTTLKKSSMPIFS